MKIEIDVDDYKRRLLSAVKKEVDYDHQSPKMKKALDDGMIDGWMATTDDPKCLV